MDDLNLPLLLSRWIHIGAAIVALGGVVFLRFVLLPSASDVLDEERQGQLREAVRQRWARFVHACLALLILTGAVNFVILALPPKIHALPYHPIFGVKLLAALTIFFLASALAGRSPGFENIRRNSRKWLGLIVALGALILLLSGVLNQVRTAEHAAKAAVTTPDTP